MKSKAGALKCCKVRKITAPQNECCNIPIPYSGWWGGVVWGGGVGWKKGHSMSCSCSVPHVKILTDRSKEKEDTFATKITFTLSVCYPLRRR